MGLVVEPKPELRVSDASAAFDNFTRRTYDVPAIHVERVLRLYWPDTGLIFIPEWAPSLEGPWLPVQGSEFPGMRYLDVPTSGTQGFYKLRLAP